VVEVFGHQRYAGYVTTEAFGQAVLFRVDVPPLPARERVTKHWEYPADLDHGAPPGSTVQEAAVQGYTKYVGPGAIYAMTPCTQDAAQKAVEAMQARKVTVVRLAPDRALEPPRDDAADNNDDDGCRDGEDDDAITDEELGDDDPAQSDADALLRDRDV
jgi:hypothetical protein